MNKFCAHKATVDRLNESGKNEQDRIDDVVQMYERTKPFTIMKKKGVPSEESSRSVRGLGKGCQWQALPSPVQCEETATRTWDLPVTGGKTLPLAPGLPFTFYHHALLEKTSQ